MSNIFLVSSIRVLGGSCFPAAGRVATLFLAVFLLGSLFTPPLMAMSASPKSSPVTENQVDTETAELFTNCAPVHLDVEVTVKQLREESNRATFDLAKERVRASIEKLFDRNGIRVRGDGGASVPGLHVMIGIAERAYSVNMDFKKPLMDTRYSGQSLQATSWSTRTVGMHAWETDYLVNVVTSRAGKFATKYREANETCSR